MSSRRSARISSRGKKAQTQSPKTTAPSGTQTLDKYLVSTGSSKRKQSWVQPPEESERNNQPPKRRQFQIQNQWQPITSCDQITTRTLVPSPVPPTQQVPCSQAMAAAGASSYTFRNIFIHKSSVCPLPDLKWADPKDVWDVMKGKEKKYLREPNYMSRHPCLQFRMRTILLDWIIEVCEVYRLHRETFYLAADFVDRYLSTQSNVQKYQLQLLGVTALFIAAKIEEIYPPKISEFAYVTDGACVEADIVAQELIMLKTLNWDLCPMTVNGWTTLYLNILNKSEVGGETCLTRINYSRHSFVTLSRLMDLCVLDEGSLHFPYSIIAASILYHFGSEPITEAASGYSFSDIEKCVNWLAPFAVTVREMAQPVVIRAFDDVMPEDYHNIQTHDVTVPLLDEAKARQKAMELARSRASPENLTLLPDVLTPPSSKHKHSSLPQPINNQLGLSILQASSPSVASLNQAKPIRLGEMGGPCVPYDGMSTPKSSDFMSQGGACASLGGAYSASAGPSLSTRSSMENLHL